MVGFIEENGIRYAGNHLLLDLYGCSGDLSGENILKICERAAIVTGATVLFSHQHPFEGGGNSGVVILAESHISFHYFYEEDNFISIDVYLCGDCNPHLAVPVFLKEFTPKMHRSRTLKRGDINSKDFL